MPHTSKRITPRFTALPSRPKIYLSTAAPVVRDRWGINEKTVKGEVIPLIVKVAALMAAAAKKGISAK